MWMIYGGEVRTHSEQPGFPSAKLPLEITIALLLNPMYGGMLQGSGDMIASLLTVFTNKSCL